MSTTNQQNENPMYPIDLTIFKDHINQNFMNILDSMPDTEKLVILAKPCLSKLNFCTNYEQLTQRNIKEKIQLLGKDPPNNSNNIPNIIYIIPPEKSYIKTIESHIIDNNKSKEKSKKNFNQKYHLIFIPKITNEIHSLLKEINLEADYKTHSLCIDMYSLDYDLLSLEDHYAFYDLYVNKNLDILSILANCILKYETVFGKIKHKYYKGNLSKKLNILLSQLEKENLNNDDDDSTLGCIILDRSVDMVTPFCTPFSYEGLLDEYFGINFNNSIKVPPKILEKDSKDNFIKIDLRDSDKFYTEIKDFSFNKIKVFLPKRLKEHSEILEAGKKKMDDMKKIQENLIKVKQIKEERNSLTNHINLADYIAQNQKEPLKKYYLIMEQTLLFGEVPKEIYTFIDNELGKKAEEYNFLRILCLMSVIQSGFKSRIFDQIKKEFYQIYGFQEIFLWRNLEKVGILKSADSSYFYKDVDKKLKLIFEDINNIEPNDISYSYGGYAPIGIRLIEKAVTKGWSQIVDVLNKIPGEYNFPKDEKEFIESSNEKQFILLVFIGGITFGELSSIRYLNQKLKNKKFIVLTTDMINYKKLFNSLRQGRYSYIPGEIQDMNDNSSCKAFSQVNFAFSDVNK